MDVNSLLASLVKDKDSLHKECAELQALHKEKLLKVSEIDSAISIIKLKLDSEILPNKPDKNAEPSKNEDKETGSEISTIKSEFTLVSKNVFSPENQSSISLANGSEQILERVGKPLHITELAKELETLGRFANTQVINGAVRKDHKNRFINLGGNTWDLRHRYPQDQVREDETEIETV